MVRTCVRRAVWIVLAVLGALALTWLPRLAAETPASAPAEPRDLHALLQEMGALEAQLGQAQSERGAQAEALLRGHKTLQEIEQQLRHKAGLADEGRQTLKQLEARAAARRRDLDRQLAMADQATRQARTALPLLAASLIQSDGPARDPRQQLALAVLARTHHDRGLSARARAERLRREADTLARGNAEADAIARQYSIFTDFTMEELQGRHGDLARQVASLEAQTQQQEETVERLAQRREALNELVQNLARAEAERLATAGPTPEPTASTGAAPETQAAAASDAPSIPDESAASPLVSQTAAGIGPDAAAASQDAGAAQNGVLAQNASADPATDRSEYDKTQLEGTRRLFWRALPVGVRALAGGKVVFSGPFAGYRHLLILDHGTGWRSLVGNLTRCWLSEGEMVTPGQVMGEYQVLQDSRGQPLWFEVRQGIRAVPAEQWPELPADWETRLFAQLKADTPANP